MNPVQSNVFPLLKLGGAAAAGAAMPPGASLGNAATNSTLLRPSSDEVLPAWYRRANPNPNPNPSAPTAPEPEKQDPFFAVIDKLMDQLDAMIGQLLGGGATPGSGAGTTPGTGAGTSPGTGAPASPGEGGGTMTPMLLTKSPDMFLA